MTEVLKAGYAGLTGLCNSGKSALINGLSERRISPSCPHEGTTRVPVTSIHAGRGVQICFIDTPPLDRYYDPDLLGTMDVICHAVNSRHISEELQAPSLRKLRRDLPDVPVVIAATFVDHLPRQLRGAIVNQISVLGDYSEIVPVCPPAGGGMTRLREVMTGFMPVSDRLFPDNLTSLHSERFLVCEQVRISLFSVLPPDIASTTAVQIEEFSIRDEKRYVRANLHVSRYSSKGVVIGRKGTMLQNIAEIASVGASRILERPLYLDLWVKVRESWPTNPDDLREFGYVC